MLEKIQKTQTFEDAGGSIYVYPKELDRFYFQQDMASGAWKDLARRTASEKLLRDKAFAILIQNMMEINMGFHQWSTNFLIKNLKFHKVLIKNL